MKRIALTLIVGIALAVTGHVTILPFIIGLIVLAVLALSFKLPEMNYDAPTERVELQGHDLIIILLLAAIALRSFVWSAWRSSLTPMNASSTASPMLR